MQTKQLIKSRFSRLYGKTNYNKITVKSLCEYVPVARTTFYSYFESLDDVKAEIEDEAITGIRAVCENIYSGNAEQIFISAVGYISEHRDIFYPFLVSQPNARFIKKFKAEIIKHFNEGFSLKQSDKNGLELNVFASAVIACYTYFLEHPEETDIKSLSEKTNALIGILNIMI